MKQILLSWGEGCGGYANYPRAPIPTVPSPIPPWKRQVESPLTGSLFASGTIGLNFDTTYLQATTPLPAVNGVVPPYVAALPNGNYIRQMIRIYIPSNLLTTTAIWSVVGVFAGFTSLTFNNIGFSALLEWDGAAWQQIGGNALPVP